MTPGFRLQRAILRPGGGALNTKGAAGDPGRVGRIRWRSRTR
jgi:hypothetical protein